MNLNRLKGSIGDKLNATLAAIAYNLRIDPKDYFLLYYLLLIFAKYPKKLPAIEN